MKKILIIFLGIFLISGSSLNTFAYWAGSIEANSKTEGVVIQIGDWDFNNLEGVLIIDDLTISEQKESIPAGTVVSYEGSLYMVIHSNYAPYWHGMPDEDILWAVVYLGLHWIEGTNYRINSVVIRNRRWFIANHLYNQNDWYVNDPLAHSQFTWSEWREIEPLIESDFDYFPNTTIKDYTINPNNVTYK